jgi:hypothetical protein
MKIEHRNVNEQKTIEGPTEHKKSDKIGDREEQKKKKSPRGRGQSGEVLRIGCGENIRGRKDASENGHRKETSKDIQTDKH